MVIWNTHAVLQCFHQSYKNKCQNTFYIMKYIKTANFLLLITQHWFQRQIYLDTLLVFKITQKQKQWLMGRCRRRLMSTKSSSFKTKQTYKRFVVNFASYMNGRIVYGSKIAPYKRRCGHQMDIATLPSDSYATLINI